MGICVFFGKYLVCDSELGNLGENYVCVVFVYDFFIFEKVLMCVN